MQVTKAADGTIVAMLSPDEADLLGVTLDAVIRNTKRRSISHDQVEVMGDQFMAFARVSPGTQDPTVYSPWGDKWEVLTDEELLNFRGRCMTHAHHKALDRELRARQVDNNLESIKMLGRYLDNLNQQT